MPKHNVRFIGQQLVGYLFDKYIVCLCLRFEGDVVAHTTKHERKKKTTTTEQDVRETPSTEANLETQ